MYLLLARYGYKGANHQCEVYQASHLLLVVFVVVLCVALTTLATIAATTVVVTTTVVALTTLRALGILIVRSLAILLCS